MSDVRCAMLAAFDASAGSELRRLLTRRDVVARLRKAIPAGLVDYDAGSDRVSITSLGRAKMGGLRVAK